MQQADSKRQRKRQNFIQDWMEYRGLSPKEIQEATGAAKDLEWKWRNKDNFPTEEYLASLLELLGTERECLFAKPPGKANEGKGGQFHSHSGANAGTVIEAQYTGRVGAGPSALNVEADPNESRHLPVIAGETEVLKIAELDGDSLGILFNRWYVVYGPPIKFMSEMPYGQLCLVLTVDDEMTVKWLAKTKKRGVKLLDAADEIYKDGVELQWAAPVLGMRPQ